MRRACVELERRAAAVLRSDYRRTFFDALFSEERASRSVPSDAKQSTSIKELVGSFLLEYQQHHTERKRIEKVESVLALIQQVLGEERSVASIDVTVCRSFRDLLATLPSNRSKFFAVGTTVEKMIRDGRARELATLSSATQDTYLGVLRQLLEEGVRRGLLAQNPASGLSPAKTGSATARRRSPFSLSQLQKIFAAPLYRGCVNDGSSYAKVGPNRPRNERFWIPLLALFTGMRLNEICQLHTTDVKRSVNRVAYFDVNDDGPKRKKTKGSRREIPIHPLLLAAGFMDFVQEKHHASEKRLFPALRQSSRGYYSERFQRWFNEGFLPSCGASQPGTSFHSFRHTFADAMRDALVPREIMKAVGGWSPDKSVMDSYGNGFNADRLQTYVDKINYPELDLSFLFVPSFRGKASV